MSDNADGLEQGGREPVPAAFYSDARPADPPQGDPHWAEFTGASDDGSLPEWMLVSLPITALAVAALHGIVAIILLLIARHLHVGL